MKILIAAFILEANANIPQKTTFKDISFHTGQECENKMTAASQAMKNRGFEVLPSIVADGGSNGIMEKGTFLRIEKELLDCIRDHIRGIDGIFLHLHGASEVEGIGSGEHHILFEIRRLTGMYMPVAVVCDPHGNLSKEYVEATTIIRSYRESPHTDIDATNKLVANYLCDILNDRKQITPVYRKLPLILGGEQSVSGDEPVRSINQLLDDYEDDSRIMSCSWHVGYIRHDTEIAGCGIVVVPRDNKYRDYANEIADKLYQYIWDKRKEFHYTGLTAEPQEALQWALIQKSGPVFITDSGDNVTSGSLGVNTFILRQLLSIDNLKKKVLIAAIRDTNVFEQLEKEDIGQKVQIELGMDYDSLSMPVLLNVVVKGKCTQIATKIFGDFGELGKAVVISVEDKPIDIIVANTNQPYVEREQTIHSGADWGNYDIVVIKCGYAFPEMKRDGACIMSLTDGATFQNTAKLPFKKIMRPMYPIDAI